MVPPGAKADPDLTQDIAYIYEILNCNQFIILSKATALHVVALVRMMMWLQLRIS